MTSRELERLVLELRAELEASVDATILENSKENEDALGPEWLPVLTAIIGAPVTVEIVRGIVSVVLDWCKRRKPMTVKISSGDGKEYMITGTHMTGDELAIIAGHLTK